MAKQSFIQHVAQDLIKRFGHDLSQYVIVFPNKRAALFMNQALAEYAAKPIWSPTYITINELFEDNSEKVVADDILLLCLLYKSYVSISKSKESLDDFFTWGQMLLSDFDDIDKNLANPKQVLRDISNLHELDTTDFLTDSQKQVLKTFFNTFQDNHESVLRARFIQLWNRLYDIYVDFNKELDEKKIAYEGKIYREVCFKEELRLKGKGYIFVGFNLLQKSEQKLFERIERTVETVFYWDYDNYYLNTNSEAGRFINKNILKFKNSFDSENDDIYNNFSKIKDITYISASTENAQAKFISNWLNNTRIKSGHKTAIVMCNENLLQSITHSLPSEANDINITSGYPLSQTPIANLIKLLIQLQIDGKLKNKNVYRLKYVINVLQHQYINSLSEDISLKLDKIKKDNKYYLTDEELNDNDVLKLLFSSPVNSDENKNDNDAKFENEEDNVGKIVDNNLALNGWLIKIVEIIAVQGKKNYANDAFFQESIFRMYKLLNRVQALIDSEELSVSVVTYQRILNQIIQTTRIPFHGEPVKGIQIMGVLETRNLDFDHLLILSCNEGYMPKHNSDTSLIPFSIKKAFGLTTVDNKVAIYAYYFYRLIQRATDVTIMYNNATGDKGVNEMSRFMLQMLVESNHKIKRQHIKTQLTPTVVNSYLVEKNEQICKQLNEIESIYPTDINTYLRCQKQFFYKKILKIKELNEPDVDDIDNRVFGNIFHSAAEYLYNDLTTKDGLLTNDIIASALKNEFIIYKAVDRAFEHEITGIQPHTNVEQYQNGLQIINREVVATYLRQLLKTDQSFKDLHILATEKELSKNIDIETINGQKTLKISGRIDRLDMISLDGGKRIIRVIDYKTGRKQPKIKTLEEVFDEEKIEDHSDYYLQTLLYSVIVEDNKLVKDIDNNQTTIAPALLFIGHSASQNYNPILTFDKDTIDDIGKYSGRIIEGVKTILEDIFDIDKPFKPTEHTQRCQSCPYRKICYR